MKLSELQDQLDALMAAHGDIPIETLDAYGNRIDLEPPTVAYRLILAGRATKPRFWDKFNYDEADKGPKVIRL